MDSDLSLGGHPNLPVNKSLNKCPFCRTKIAHYCYYSTLILLLYQGQLVTLSKALIVAYAYASKYETVKNLNSAIQRSEFKTKLSFEKVLYIWYLKYSPGQPAQVMFFIVTLGVVLTIHLSMTVQDSCGSVYVRYLGIITVPVTTGE